MNIKGFAIIETLIVVVVLTTALILLYNAYTGAIIEEKGRLYYDDVNYIFRSIHIRDYLLDNVDFKEFADVSMDKRYTLSIGSASSFNNINAVEFDNLLRSLNVKRMIIFKPEWDEVKKCTDEVIDGEVTISESEICKISFLTTDYEFRKYIRTLSGSINTKEYILILEFSEERDGSVCDTNNCVTNYAWIDTGVSYE